MKPLKPYSSFFLLPSRYSIFFLLLPPPFFLLPPLSLFLLLGGGCKQTMEHGAKLLASGT
uniref:Uncharacterized protein n=1 Tax=Cucumis melo TaxID=3656 RepID=A0A9I9EHZ0_CUCME